MAAPRRDQRLRRGATRWVWLALGWAAVGLGCLGIVVPGLPTTVFFVLAASCFARSSPRFERWVLSLPRIGPLVRDYRAGVGMPRRAKVTAIAVMAVAVVASAAFFLSSPIVRAAVVAAGGLGVWYVGWRIPTRDGFAPPGKASWLHGGDQATGADEQEVTGSGSQRLDEPVGRRG